jgi:hypothetical protein
MRLLTQKSPLCHLWARPIRRLGASRASCSASVLEVRVCRMIYLYGYVRVVAALQVAPDVRIRPCNPLGKRSRGARHTTRTRLLYATSINIAQKKLWSPIERIALPRASKHKSACSRCVTSLMSGQHVYTYIHLHTYIHSGLQRTIDWAAESGHWHLT